MSVVIPTATYACETWMRTASITNMLECLPPMMPQNHLEDLVEKKTGWTRTPTAKRATSECGNGLGARGRQEEEREAKEDVETYV
ncbi:hypothetical protein AAFF_G00028830 [Aldrovandia affinis]|uniref:Uncharacterized protein n=1 Tax=Aldrovandia affinis TaxID=143900 RepID=A0AAD7R267_9TELE|nr:hypothetical protein AAFF_G00028830 [Aldrovandia affinis]